MRRAAAAAAPPEAAGAVARKVSAVQRAAEIAQLVAQYLSDRPGLERMSEAARRAGRPEATVEIAKDLAGLVGL